MSASFELRPDRREVLYALGSFVAVGFLGCGGSSPASPSSTSSSSSSTSSTNAPCVVTPALTEGPYFVDERLNRSDLRSDPATGGVRPGVPLTLLVKLSQISTGGACTALAGALVDVWHCDALGVYSDIGAQGTVGQKFLRGYQVSDANGEARFVTVYPGWYPAGAAGLEFTSQMFFDEALTDVVHAQAPYNTKGRRNTTNANDGIYQGGGSQVLFPLTTAGSGYEGTFNVGVRI
jgi:protocatechuate 3,4-dioxygenase beta subunit